MGANLSGGIALKWLKTQVLNMESYEEMTKAGMESGVGSNGLIFLPYLNGERTPYNDPDAKAVFFGLTLRHSRNDMIRAVMEGIVLGMQNSICIFNDIGIQIDRVIASGGVARSRLFLQILADVFGKEIYLNSIQEQACMGAAISAATGTGAFNSVDEACLSMVCLHDTPVSPNMENNKIYQEILQKYRMLYNRNHDLF